MCNNQEVLNKVQEMYRVKKCIYTSKFDQNTTTKNEPWKANLEYGISFGTMLSKHDQMCLLRHLQTLNYRPGKFLPNRRRNYSGKLGKTKWSSEQSDNN